MSSERIRIRLKGFDHRILDPSAVKIVDTARRTGARARTHSAPDLEIHREPVAAIDKKSREQYEIRTHKRLIDIVDPTPKTVDALMKLDLAAGVDVEIKL